MSTVKYLLNVLTTIVVSVFYGTLVGVVFPVVVPYISTGVFPQFTHTEVLILSETSLSIICITALVYMLYERSKVIENQLKDLKRLLEKQEGIEKEGEE